MGKGKHQVADVLTKSGVSEENIKRLFGREGYDSEELMKRGD